MPVREAIKEIATRPMRIAGAIGAKVERASRTTRHRLARKIVRKRLRWAFLLATTWVLWLLLGWLVWLALTGKPSAQGTAWLYKAKLWLGAVLAAMTLATAHWKVAARWDRRKR